MTNQRKRCPLRMFMRPVVEKMVQPEPFIYQCVEEACEWFVEADEPDEGCCAIMAIGALVNVLVQQKEK